MPKELLVLRPEGHERHEMASAAAEYCELAHCVQAVDTGSLVKLPASHV